MPLENPIARDGDAGFIGFARCINPAASSDSAIFDETTEGGSSDKWLRWPEDFPAKH